MKCHLLHNHTHLYDMLEWPVLHTTYNAMKDYSVLLYMHARCAPGTFPGSTVLLATCILQWSFDVPLIKQLVTILRNI